VDFKIKRNGVFRARLVACGYSQVPRVDFNESIAPIIYDLSFCAMLIVKLMEGLHATIIDVETPFLYGDLQEEIYMNIPDGLESNGNECLRLKKTIYENPVCAFYKSHLWISCVNHIILRKIY
jgi:Reverse transcriptase (RNA-dependent DNA polymerase)